LLNRIANEAKAWRVQKGLHTPRELGGPNNRTFMLAKMMEAAEGIGTAAQAVRENNFDKFSFSITMGIVWLMDIAASTGVDLDQAFNEIVILHIE